MVAQVGVEPTTFGVMGPVRHRFSIRAVALAGIEPAMSPYEGGALPFGDRASAPDRIRTGSRPLDRRMH